MDTNTYKTIDGSAFRFGIVRARFNEEITEGLLDGCLKTLEKAGVEKGSIHIVEVPGAVEIGYALQELALREDIDALIALGAIIKGGTPHFEHISHMAHDAINTVSLKHRLPVIAGVITVFDKAQAEERSGSGSLNRGVEAAEVALEMAALRKKEGFKRT